MNCLYITLFFNIVAGIVQIFIKSWNQLLYPRVIEVCRLPFEPRHNFFLHLIMVVEIFPARCFFRWRNKWKSLSARFGLYGGWSSIYHSNLSRSAVVTCAEWGRALSWSRHKSRDSIPPRWFWMARRSRVIVSQYAAALIVAPGGMKSTRRMPFLSQKTDAMIFFHWNWSFEFLGSGGMRMMPLQWLLLGFRSVVKNPCFISSHNGVQKIISFLCVAREQLQRGNHPFRFVIVR